MRYHIVTLGCAKNVADSERIARVLGEGAHAEVGAPAAADVVIVNTCGFIDQAKEESENAVLEQVRRKEAGEVDRVVVAGCMVQKYGAELAAEIPEVDHFLGLDELEKAPAAALGLPSLPRFAAKPLATRLYDDLAPRVLTSRRGYAYLKVAEGCNNPCTFCTIPQMRGLQRSRSVESLVREARSLEAQGVSELVLISQDTTRYGDDVGLGREGLGVEDMPGPDRPVGKTIGYHLRRDYWHQGLVTEAATACRDWAFAHVKADRLISLIRPENLPSRRVAERNGMTIWKEVDWRGLRHLVYSITATQSNF